MQPIIQHLFQASSLEDVSRQRLESFVAEYPSFGIGHYLLSRKLMAEGADSYMQETQRTNLYFTNPFWLQWLLENPEENTAGGAIQATSFVHPVVDTPEIEPVKDTMDVAVEEALIPGHEPELATSVSIAESAAADSNDPDQPETMVALAEKLAESPEPTAAELLLQSIEEARELRESLQKINEDFHTARPLPAATIAAPHPAEDPIKDEEAPFVLEEESVVEGPTASVAAEVPPVDEVAPHVVHAEPLVAAAEAPVAAAEPEAVAEPATEPEAKPTEQTYIFEPYHTIDYFASQGIKLHLEENPSDQLGKQLKSFTEWLKTMRRLPQKEREVMPDQVAEQTIQTIAAHSVVGREVVTETMAEVLAKQGMPERARALYEKLSLLNPDKKAYFAAKIEQLNSH